MCGELIGPIHNHEVVTASLPQSTSAGNCQNDVEKTGAVHLLLGLLVKRVQVPDKASKLSTANEQAICKLGFSHTQTEELGGGGGGGVEEDSASGIGNPNKDQASQL